MIVSVAICVRWTTLMALMSVRLQQLIEPACWESLTSFISEHANLKIWFSGEKKLNVVQQDIIIHSTTTIIKMSPKYIDLNCTERSK